MQVMLPKPGEKQQIIAQYDHRQITFERVIGKVLIREITNRLVWKLVRGVEGCIQETEDMYSNVMRITNSISEVKVRKENTVLTEMNFESCYEKKKYGEQDCYIRPPSLELMVECGFTLR